MTLTVFSCNGRGGLNAVMTPQPPTTSGAQHSLPPSPSSWGRTLRERGRCPGATPTGVTHPFCSPSMGKAGRMLQPAGGKVVWLCPERREKRGHDEHKHLHQLAPRPEAGLARGNLHLDSLQVPHSTHSKLKYSCLENPMDGGAWWATVHGVAKSRT